MPDGGTAFRFAEVLRLYEVASRVFSIYGGVSEEYLDEGGRLLCLYLAADRVKSQIKYYASSLLRPEFLKQLRENARGVHDLLRHAAAAFCRQQGR